MGIRARIKNYTRLQTIKALIGLIPKFSNENLVKMTYVAERLADTDWTKTQIKEIRKYSTFNRYKSW